MNSCWHSPLLISLLSPTQLPYATDSCPHWPNAFGNNFNLFLALCAEFILTHSRLANAQNHAINVSCPWLLQFKQWSRKLTKHISCIRDEMVPENCFLNANMAAKETEDDENWLYGNGENSDEKKTENDSTKIPNDANIEGKNDNDEMEIGNESKEDVNKEAGELSGEELGLSVATEADGEEDGEDSDSDDDDDVQVTIKEVDATTGYGSYPTSVNLNITKRGPYAQPGGITTQPSSITIGKAKGLDLETVGSINGVPLYDFSLDSLEDKPWMKPGADITDYFNYGFQEETWKVYCEKQRKMRAETAAMTMGLVTVKTTILNPLPAVNENSKYSVKAPPVPVVLSKKAGPPPGRKVSGCIDVIGGGTSSSLASRRVNSTPPKENPIQVMTGRTSSGPSAVMPPGITSMPPPGYMGPPQNLTIPPPGLIPPGMTVGPPLGMPPPNLSVPPPAFQDMYSYNRFSSLPGQGSVVHHNSANSQNEDERSHSYDEYGGRSYDGDRESRRDWDRKGSPSRDSERYRDLSRDRSRSPDEYDRRHRDHRDRDYDQDKRDRDRERRYRDRDRDRERDRERDDRHRSRRKHRDEEEYDREDSGEKHHSSRHKRKRTKKERDESEEVPDAKEILESEPITAPPGDN